LVSADRQRKLLHEASQRFQDTYAGLLIGGDPQVHSQLEDLYMEHHALRLDYQKEFLALQAKYIGLSKPIFEKRAEVIRQSFYHSENTTSAMPGFWLRVLSNHSTFSSALESWDEIVLIYLVDVRAEYLDPEKQGSFRIEFEFHPHCPYFKNTVLSKTFYLETDQNTGEQLLARAVGTKIEWNERPDGESVDVAAQDVSDSLCSDDSDVDSCDALKTFNVTLEAVTKVYRHRATGEKRERVVGRVRPSFFHFFDSRSFPSEEELRSLPSPQLCALEHHFATEYELAQIIRARLIPQASGWYLDQELDSEEEEEDAPEN